MSSVPVCASHRRVASTEGAHNEPDLVVFTYGHFHMHLFKRRLSIWVLRAQYLALRAPAIGSRHHTAPFLAILHQIQACVLTFGACRSSLTLQDQQIHLTQTSRQYFHPMTAAMQVLTPSN